MKISRAPAIAAAVSLLAVLPVQPALAGALQFKVHNNASSAITAVKVRGAEIAGFKRIMPGKAHTMTVTMPGNQCQAFVQIRLDSGTVKDGAANICDASGVVVTPGPGGLQLLSGSKVKLWPAR